MKKTEKTNSLLIVDDDVSNLLELTHILQPEYKISTAKDGITALGLAKKAQPDLILLDIIMPGMNGFEVLAELKENELTKDIPVIFITGVSEDNNESAGLSVGAIDYIRKPFDAMVVTLRVRHQMQIINLRHDLEYAAKNAEMASRTKSVFLANMSHEIRTPMNAILGVTEILIQHKTLPADIEEGLSKIYSSCDLLLGIINDILDFSKIEAGKLDIMPGQYKLENMINDSIHLNMMRINSKPIEFELQIDEHMPAKLFGDELRIKQILNNLLSNAFKYTESGNVTLSAGFEQGREKDNITLVLSVKDTGCGMTKEQLDKMFEEYSRFNQENNITIEGTGLGLAITQRLVNLMNGEMHVESEPGAGSLFVVKLPQQKIDNEMLGTDAAANLQKFSINYVLQRKREHITRDPMPYGNVMVVDDVETNLYVAEGLLKLYKLQIDTAMCGQDAIDKIKDGKIYDIIFMDHMMPEMDGIETVRHIRELGYLYPIAVLTANAIAGQADMFMRSGFDDFISKPIDIRQLDSILNKFVRDKQPPEVIEAARMQKSNSSHAEADGSEDDSTAHIDKILLESFIRDAKKAIDGLEEICPQTGSQKENFNDEEQLRKFTIIVHGIKSSLWNINENELAKLAYTLEQGGREHNVVLLTDFTIDFINQLRTLLKKLEYIRDKQNKHYTPLEEDIEILRDMFKAIQKKAAECDRKGVLSIISGIKNCTKETKATLDYITEHVVHSEFEEAEHIAAAYETGLSIRTNRA